MSVTEALAQYVTHSTYEAIPRDIRDEAKRAIFNYLGCALGGAVERTAQVVDDCALRLVTNVARDRIQGAMRDVLGERCGDGHSKLQFDGPR